MFQDSFELNHGGDARRIAHDDDDDDLHDAEWDAVDGGRGGHRGKAHDKFGMASIYSDVSPDEGPWDELTDSTDSDDHMFPARLIPYLKSTSDVRRKGEPRDAPVRSATEDTMPSQAGAKQCPCASCRALADRLPAQSRCSTMSFGGTESTRHRPGARRHRRSSSRSSKDLQDVHTKDSFASTLDTCLTNYRRRSGSGRDADAPSKADVKTLLYSVEMMSPTLVGAICSAAEDHAWPVFNETTLDEAAAIDCVCEVTNAPLKWLVALWDHFRRQEVIKQTEMACFVHNTLYRLEGCKKAKTSREEVLDFICKNFESVSEANAFMTLPRRAIEAIVTSKYVMATEFDLFERTMEWANNMNLPGPKLHDLLEKFHFGLFIRRELRQARTNRVATRIAYFPHMLRIADETRPVIRETHGKAEEIFFDISNLTAQWSKALSNGSAEQSFCFLAFGLAWELIAEMRVYDDEDRMSLGVFVRFLHAEDSSALQPAGLEPSDRLMMRYGFRAYEAADVHSRRHILNETDSTQVDMLHGAKWWGNTAVMPYSMLKRACASRHTHMVSINIASCKHLK